MRHALLLLVLLASVAPARPPYRKALLDLLDLPAASPLNDCRTCHLPGKSEDDRPHNAFGARLKAVRAELRKAGNPSDITARLLAIAEEDSDGDGTPNLLELLAGTFPGDAAERPGAKEVASAKEKRVRLLASLNAYRWRPFERVERPPIPMRPGRNPIDAFLEEQRRDRKLIAMPEAPRAVLLRRVTLDLTGLPPTVEELDEFHRDTRSDAYERVVERLLASPRFGERWGRHWMDVWRYSDWAGFGSQIRDSQPHIWRWRDWIIESLNAGKGYDRMVQEMLAADEIVPENESALRATGFLVRNYKLLSREKWMQDAVDHTAMAFLGVTLGCARCHDHMYDALTQKEYYQVRAIFTPHNVRIDRVPGQVNTAIDWLARVYDADLNAKTFLLIRGDDRTPGKDEVPPGVPELLGGTFAVKPVSLPRGAIVPERHPFVLEELIESLEKTVALHDQDIAKARLRVQFTAWAGSPLTALTALPLQVRLREAAEMGREAAAEVVAKYRLLATVERLEDEGKAGAAWWKEAAERLVASERRFAYLQARNRAFTLRHGLYLDPKSKVPLAKQRADADRVLASAEAALKAAPSTKYTPRPVKTYPATSTGRRLALAKWITSRDNPLAARVAVNHVWARHFGTGIVPGMFDFGRNAPPATHPALLDWLAVEMMERGWSVKDLHRLIVTSAAYRADSRPRPENVARDPDNVYLWRFTPRRVEAEVVRDALFFVSGRLDGRMGGKEVPYQQGLSVPRRSVYIQHAQEKQMDFLLLFDCASVTEAYLRKQAIMPGQALALLNSELALDSARLAAASLHSRAVDDAAFVRLAFAHVLSRGPTAEERTECLAFLEQQSRRGTPSRARSHLLHVLLNHHEFVTIR